MPPSFSYAESLFGGLRVGNMIRYCMAILAFALVALAPMGTAHASRVSPMSVDLEPVGRGSVARIQFTNTADRDFPVEVRAFRGEITEDGQLELEAADEDFLLFPSQLVVAPLGEQVFRVQYVGNPDLTEAQVYYLSVRQLPIELDEGAPQVQVVVNFNVFINVEPDGTVVAPRVGAIEAAEGEDSTGIAVQVVNDGTGMLLAGKREWAVSGRTLSGETFSNTYNPAEMGIKIGVGIVAPGKARRFYIPLEGEIDASSVTVDLK